MGGVEGRILVTGGAGFIGSAFVRDWLRDARGPVWNLDALAYSGRLESLFEARNHADHYFLHGDVAELADVRAAIDSAQPDFIVHFAAESHVDRSIEQPDPFVRTNVLGAQLLFDEAYRYWGSLAGERKSRFRVVNVSTDEVYGEALAGQVFDESAPFQPNSPYAATKAGAAHLARAYARTYGLPVISSFGVNTYGPCQHPEKLIPTAILAAQQGRRIPMYGDGLQQRDWIHVEDHCHAIRVLLERGEPGGCYNVGGVSPLPNRELLDSLVQILVSEGVVEAGVELLQPVADRPGHDRRYAVNSKRLRALGWTPKIRLEEGLNSTVRWYLSHAEWLAGFGEDDYERRRGLKRLDGAEGETERTHE